MGDLIKIPHSELNATVEVLDHQGVTQKDFEVLRKASSWSQSIVGRIHKTDPYLWAMLEIEQSAKKAGFLESDFHALAKDEDKLRQILKFQRVSDNGIAKIKPTDEDSARAITINETTIVVNLGIVPKSLFSGATVTEHIGGGWVIVEKRADGLYVDSKKVILHLSKRQKNGKWPKGYELREELTGKPILNANVLDALLSNPHLLPEDWKRDENGNIRHICFWGTIYSDSDGFLCVCCLCFGGGEWRSGYGWLGGDWSDLDPAALCAS